MKGLELAERYYYAVCAPMVAEKFPRYSGRIAAGLVGEGSECYGYDDELSQDHDWGAAICLWLTEEDYDSFGRELEAAVAELPVTFQGYSARPISSLGQGRTGVLKIDSFYAKFLGTSSVPLTLAQWRRIPEHHLAAATNGKVFADPLGAFSAIRAALLADYYPEDIRKKKLAARCMTAAQAGQYNYPRVVGRGEFVAAHLAAAEFIRAVSSMTYLLNRRYQPFYKWLHRGLKDLPFLGDMIAALLTKLVTGGAHLDEQVVYEYRSSIIEDICLLLIAELRRQGLTDSASSFLLDHGMSIHSTIQDPALRASNPWVE